MNEKGYITSNLYDWTKEEEKGFFEKYIDKLRENVELKPFAKEIIHALKQEHEIYIVTARDKITDKDPCEEAKLYLEKHGIFFDEIIAECHDKLKYCLENKIDVIIDDEPQNIDAIAPKIPVIVFRGVQNENCSGKNVMKVDNWKEVYEIIKKLEKK